MSTASLKDRDPFSARSNYDRKTQSKILRVQLQTLACGKDKPTIIQKSLFNAATILILSLRDMEREFEDHGTFPSKYESRLRSLQGVLVRLGLTKDKRGRKRQGKDFDLTNIINGE